MLVQPPIVNFFLHEQIELIEIPPTTRLFSIESGDSIPSRFERLRVSDHFWTRGAVCRSFYKMYADECFRYGASLHEAVCTLWYTRFSVF